MGKDIEVNMLYEQLIARFTRWAENVQDIRAAIIIGSRARTQRAADEWADLDLIVVTNDPQRYISSQDWIREMGNPIVTFIEETAGGDEKERRVLYEGMLDVDFAIFPTSRGQMLQGDVNQVPVAVKTQLANALGRGMRVIVDKDDIEPKLRSLVASIGTSSYISPTEDEFLDVVNDFLYHSVWTAKHIRRGELWWASTCINCHLAHLMLRMTEWHAHATQDPGCDTWFRGRFLEEWADPRVLEALGASFTHYDENDAQESLLASMSSFTQIAAKTAEILGYSYPKHEDEQITKWIKSCFSQEN